MKTFKVGVSFTNRDDLSIRLYFKDINKFKPLTPEEETELFIRIENGDRDAFVKIIKHNLRFVITCAKKYTGQGVALIDLIQAGVLGLILSIKNFDPDKGYKFLSFAVWYIRREILKEIYNTRRTIRYPITYISKITKVKKVHDSFVTKNKREPTEEELMQLSNITQEQYNSTIINKSYCQSINTPLKEDSSTTLEETIPDTEDKYSNVFTKESISKALKCLNPREYTVITKYYGLDGEYNYSIKEIAKDLGVCDERVRQLRKGAIKKLKQRYGNILKTLLE